ncbi:MAG TPA: hypothetical protein VFH08_00055 [Chitinophagaceae bacterium]|nr:hypothetical protein [Chitinophagaceae bacterium]
MRGFLLIITAFILANNVYSQGFSAKDVLFASSLSTKKLEAYLNKRQFAPSGSRSQNGTLVRIYSPKPQKKKKKDTLDIKRSIEWLQLEDNFSFTYLTSLKDEFDKNLNLLKETGFFCGNEKDTVAVLFQRRNITVLARLVKEPTGDTLYSLFYQQHALPFPETIQVAEDLLQFNSHEFLVSAFGEKNVIKDLYYFSEKEFSKCSVLFPKTSRQAVFIWEDEVNLCKPAYLLIGGNTNNASSVSFDGVIDENVWHSKDGIYSGMSLNSLIRLNGNGFKFYGKYSKFPYMIVPENNGTLNFKKSRVVLGCLNPTGSTLLNNSTISAEDILSDNLGLYVFMIMLMPSTN